MSQKHLNHTNIDILFEQVIAKLCRLCRARHKRHRFAMQTLLNWYRRGLEIEPRLPTLSTYLGHVHVSDTYWYLSALPELMGYALDRLEKHWEGAR
jgi:hypothetical protein